MTHMAHDVYRCPTCKKRYRRLGSSTMSCCVLHGPGDCCHAFEQRVSKKGWVIRETPTIRVYSEGLP